MNRTPLLTGSSNLLSFASSALRRATPQPPRVWLAVAALLGAVSAAAAPPLPLDVTAARAAMAAGAVVWDLRAAGAVLPGALRVDAQALADWRERNDVPALAQAVSAAGINLSGRVLLVAESDAQALALAPRLAALSRGHVGWLVGGVDSWQSAGGALQAHPSTRLPMPQQLVALTDASTDAPADGATRSQGAEPADAARRRTATFAMHQPLDPWGQRHPQTVRTATVQGAVR